MKISRIAEELLQKFQTIQLDNKKIILVGLVVLIVLYSDISFVICPQIKGIKNTGSKITKLKQDINNLNNAAANLKSEQLNAQEGVVVKEKTIISQAYMPSLLQKISDMANKDNVKIMQIKPAKELKAKDISTIASLINLDLVCSYHNFGLFVNDIENAPELMAVEGMRINPDSINYMQQRISLTIKTYVKK